MVRRSIFSVADDLVSELLWSAWSSFMFTLCLLRVGRPNAPPRDLVVRPSQLTSVTENDSPTAGTYAWMLCAYQNRGGKERSYVGDVTDRYRLLAL